MCFEAFKGQDEKIGVFRVHRSQYFMTFTQDGPMR